jgi:protein-tyrosine phosphatase
MYDAMKYSEETMIRVVFVCLGNICRSPMATAIFQHLVDQAGLSAQIKVDSAGTGSWHVGEPPHHGTMTVLQRLGIAYSGRARQVTRTDLQTADYLIAMDANNVAALRRLEHQVDLDKKLYLLLDFAPPGSPCDVPDPYYEDNFDDVYHLVEVGCRGLLEHIRAEQKL